MPPRAVTHVTLPDGVLVNVTLDGGTLFANVAEDGYEDDRPEAHIVGLLLEAVQTFGQEDVRKVHLTWEGYHEVDLDGPLFTALRDLPRLVSLVLDGFCVADDGAARPWPDLRSLHLLFQGDVMAQLALFPRVERMTCWNVDIAWFDEGVADAVRVMATLPNLHTVDVTCLCNPTSLVVRLPALRRVVGYVFLPAKPAVLAAIRDRASLPGAKRLLLSLTGYVNSDLASTPEVVDAALQDLCLAATAGGVTLDLQWDPSSAAVGAPRPHVLVDGGGVADRLRRSAAARVIQKHYLAKYYDPTHTVCRKRLRRQFEQLHDEFGR
jgi:hypothetical protein